MNGAEQLAQRLAALVTGLGIRASAQGNVVKPGQGTPVIIVNRVTLSQSRGSIWIAHADIHFSLNPERPEAHIGDCAVGLAETKEQAVELAAHAWTQVTAPPVFSLLQCSPTLGADWFPDGDSSGLPGWNVFAGPYGFRGDPGAWRPLESHLRQNPLLPALSEPILNGFVRPHLNFVKLYRGYSGIEWFCDGFINGVREQVLTDRLLGLRWPDIRQFASATLFAVAYAKTV